MDNQGKPKGEWTKKAILDAVKACCEEEGVTYDPFFDSVRREYLFDLFMDACGARRKSRHAVHRQGGGDSHARVQRVG